MVRNTVMLPQDFKSSFLSCEKDYRLVLEKLFIQSKPYSDELKRLLVINTKDCLDNRESQVYKDKIKEMSLSKLIDEGYIRLTPKVALSDHAEIKSYIIMTMGNFSRTTNTEFRDCTINFDILCHTDYWDLGDCRLRPIKIMGYIDGILNKARLTGIGQLEFIGAEPLLLDENLSGYTLVYRAVHGSDDLIPGKE